MKRLMALAAGLLLLSGCASYVPGEEDGTILAPAMEFKAPSRESVVATTTTAESKTSQKPTTTTVRTTSKQSIPKRTTAARTTVRPTKPRTTTDMTIPDWEDITGSVQQTEKNRKVQDMIRLMGYDTQPV